MYTSIGFLISFINFCFYENKYYRLIYIYTFLFACNSSLIEFYDLKLFRNYYQYEKNKNVNMDLNFITLFLLANLYSFVIQNTYTEKEGNDYLSINAVSGFIDFIYFVLEFIFFDVFKNDTLFIIINYLSFIVSCCVELFLFIIILMLFFLFISSDCKCCEYLKKKFINFIRWIGII